MARARSAVVAQLGGFGARSAARLPRHRVHDADDDARSAAPQGRAGSHEEEPRVLLHPEIVAAAIRVRARRDRAAPGLVAGSGGAAAAAVVLRGRRRRSRPGVARRAGVARQGAPRRARGSTVVNFPDRLLIVSLAAFAAASIAL